MSATFEAPSDNVDVAASGWPSYGSGVAFGTSAA
jgi:hypothetical protein